MKKNLLYIIATIIITLFITYVTLYEKENLKELRNSNKNNILENINYKTIEEKNYIKKQYTFNIKELNNKENSLNFLVNNHYTEVYINNKLIYKMSISKNNKIIKTTYKYWVNIPLNDNDIKKEVKIILTPIKNTNTNNDIELKIISKYDLFINTLKENLLIITFALINIILGICYMFKTDKKHMPLLNICMGISFLSKNALTILLINKNILLGTINSLFVILSLILLIINIIEIIKHKKPFIKFLITTVILELLLNLLVNLNIIVIPIFFTIYLIYNYKKSV